MTAKTETGGETKALRQVQRALERGEIHEGNLSARGIAALLGQTTSVIYHRWGSLDGLLFAVATLGWTDLANALGTGEGEGSRVKRMAETYVTFALDRPALYRLMTDYPFDRDALRAGGVTSRRPSPLRVAKLFMASFEKRGGEEPELDAHLFHAGLHGLVTASPLATDREAALRAARRLTRKLAGKSAVA